MVILAYELLARIKHLFGKHTPVQALREPEYLWCWVCGERL